MKPRGAAAAAFAAVLCVPSIASAQGQPSHVYIRVTDRKARADVALVSEATGGHLDIVPGSATALPDRLKALGARLADAHRHQSTEYDIDHVSEATTPLPLTITVSRPNVTIEFSVAR